MPDETVDILLQIRNDQRELKKMQANFDEVRKSVSKVDEKLKSTFGSGASWAEDFQRQFRTGFNIGSGAYAAEKAIDGVLASVRGLRDFMYRGINFDSTVEQSQVAFETLLQDSDAAKNRIEDLITFAARTPFRLPGIIDANRQLQVLTDGALAGTEGLRIVGDAAAATGRPFEQVAFWIGRTYAGLKSGTPVGEATLRLIEMGLVSGETAIELQRLAKESRSADEAFQIIENTFSKTEGAMERQSRTFAGLRSTVADTLDQMAGDLSRPIFDVLKASMEELLELIGALPTAVELAVKSIEAKTSEALEKAFTATSLDESSDVLFKQLDAFEKELLKVNGEIAQVGFKEVPFSGPVRDFKGSPFVDVDEFDAAKASVDKLKESIDLIKLSLENKVGEGFFGSYLPSKSELEEQVASLSALEAEYATLTSKINNTQIESGLVGGAFTTEGSAIPTIKELNDARARLRELSDVSEKLVIARKKLAIRNAAPDIQANIESKAEEDARKAEEARLNGAESLRKKLLEGEAQISKELKTQEELFAKQTGTLEQKRAAVEAILIKTEEEGAVQLENQKLLGSRAATKQLEEQLETKRLVLLREIFKLDEQIAAEEKKKTADSYSIRVKASDLLLDQIKHEKSLLALDGLKASERKKFNSLVDEEKRLLSEKAALLEQEYQWLISIGEEEKAAAKRSEIQNTLQAADKAGAGNESKTRFERANDERLTLGDPEASFETIKEAATAAIWEFQMQAGTVTDQLYEHLLSIQDTLQGSLSNSIAGLIDGTMSFGEAWQSVAQTIGTSVVKAIADMAAQWLVAQAAMRTATLLGIQTEAVASGTAAAASAAAWAPAATASLIATLGASSASAALLPPAAAANAAALGALSAVSKIPGYEGGGEPQGRNALIRVNESGQEVIVNNQGYRNFGSSFFEGINAGTITPATLRSETVGTVEGVGSPGISLHVYNDLETAEQYLNSGRGEDHFMKLSDATRDTTQEH